GLQLTGFDNSEYGLAHRHPELKGHFFRHKAQEKYPFADKEFDLVISLACLHNLHVYELETALSEVQRVGRQGYVMLESYRNEQEMFNVEHLLLIAVALEHHVTLSADALHLAERSLQFVNVQVVQTRERNHEIKFLIGKWVFLLSFVPEEMSFEFGMTVRQAVLGIIKTGQLQS